jgi:hypothetical protein
MPRKKKSLLSFTRTRSSVTNTSSSPRPPALELYRGSVYRSINELPLDRFIACLCGPVSSLDPGDEQPEENLDLSPLIKPGQEGVQIPPDALIEAWGDIFLEYMDASRDDKARHKIQLASRIAQLDAQLQIIETSLVILQTLRVQELVEILQRKGNEDLLYPAEDLDQYFEDLNMTRHRTAEKKIDYKLLKIELEELEASETREEVGQRAERIHFTNVLARIATFKHVAVIRQSEITVAEFLAMFNEYLEYIQSTKDQNKNRKKWSL